MTPKEKAKELFDKFYMAIPSDEMGLCDEASRQCALIAVDEIMLLEQKHILDKYIELGLVSYYQEVKREIEAL
jgi:hypothetical protein